MQKLLGHILAIVRRVLPGKSPTTSASGVDVIAPPQSFRKRQVSELFLFLSISACLATRRRQGAAGLGSSAHRLAPSSSPVFPARPWANRARSPGAFVTQLRSPVDLVERILQRFPTISASPPCSRRYRPACFAGSISS